MPIKSSRAGICFLRSVRWAVPGGHGHVRWRGGRLSLAAVEPPWTGRRAVGVVDGGHERVEQARIVAAPVEVAQPTEQPLWILPAQVARLLDAQAHQLLCDGRADVGKGSKLCLA